MADTILLNNQPYHIQEADLSCLIHYGEKSGGSHFSVTMIADLFLSGSKILFITAYPMARENFMKQVAGHEEKVDYVTHADQIDPGKQAIILESGNEELFLDAVNKLPDVEEHVIFIKNMEVFSDAVFDACLGLPKIILSGDLDRCVAKERIVQTKFTTTVLFIQPEISLGYELPILEKYVGYMWSKETKGKVTIGLE